MTKLDLNLREQSAAGSASSSPRVLMALWDGGGNVTPQRALARELSRDGCDVHIVGHEAVADRFRLDGVTFHSLSTAPQFDFSVRRSLDEEMSRLGHDILGSASFAADVMAVWNTITPDVFIIDCMLVSTMAAAAESGIRFCVAHHLAWMPGGSASSILDHIYETLPERRMGASYADLINRASLVLVTSFAEFATEMNVPANVIFVGPIREPSEFKWHPQKQTDRPFVLVSLSSVYQQQDETLRNVASALSFLPINALITTGRGIQPSDIDQADNVEVRSFIDHDTVLPFVDLVITHGGLGTLSLCAGAGIPLLILPNGRDQNDNAARLEALGLARTLPTDTNPGRISATVMDMLGDSSLLASCRAFSSRVCRFGDVSHAAHLVRVQAALNPS